MEEPVHHHGREGGSGRDEARPSVFAGSFGGARYRDIGLACFVRLTSGREWGAARVGGRRHASRALLQSSSASGNDESVFRHE